MRAKRFDPCLVFQPLNARAKIQKAVIWRCLLKPLVINPTFNVKTANCITLFSEKWSHIFGRIRKKQMTRIRWMPAKKMARGVYKRPLVLWYKIRDPTAVCSLKNRWNPQNGRSSQRSSDEALGRSLWRSIAIASSARAG